MQGKIRIAVALAALAVLAALPARAAADGKDCSPGACVILVEVDGLEPEDVTQTGTPFLWLLAHPHGDDTTGAVVGNALAGRNGFMWEAARAPMSASTAASAASLLTGANPEQHGITADEMAVPGADGKLRLQRLAPAGVDGAMTALPNKQTATLFSMVTTEDRGAAAFIGDPGVANLLSDELQTAEPAWSPSATPQGEDPRLCDVPRSAPFDATNAQADLSTAANRPCPANDVQTMNAAFDGLNGEKKTPAFTYIHLAELGHVKQLTGDPDGPAVNEDPQIKRALADLDGSLATFVGRLVSQQAGSNLGGVWDKAVVVVTGNHGYETTPIHQRAPDPSAPNDPTRTLGDFIENEGEQGKTVFVPQGTMGTVYWPGAPADKLKGLAQKIRDACTCVDQVIATRALPGWAQTLGDHQSWYLDPLSGTKRTGAGGDLIVTLKPGWAFGRAVATEPARVTPSLVPNPVTPGDLDNPYNASAGGPRNRSIALLMDGPTSLVRQVKGSWLATKSSAENPLTAGGCSDAAGQGFKTANDPAKVGDDADARGHECQAETVDIPLSIAALLQARVPAKQIAQQGRLLKEAIPTLKLGDDDEDLGPPPPPEEPPPPPPPPIIISRNSVQVIPAKKPKDPFPFHGLIRRLKARVVDMKGRPLSAARRGATMTSIEVSADFGKPQSIVRLTFYKRGRKGSKGVARRLVAIAKFKPFPVKRGPAKLRLKVPAQFAPQYIGISIQEIVTVAKTGAASTGNAKSIEKPVGPRAGGIAAIDNAEWLHRRKPLKKGGR